MNLFQLSKLTLSHSDVTEALLLPAPESSKPRGSPALLIPTLDNLSSLWCRVLVDKEPLPIHEFEYGCRHERKHKFEGSELRARLLLSISGSASF